MLTATRPVTPAAPAPTPAPTYGGLRAAALAGAAPAVWGTTYLVTTELLPPGRPLLAATLRALPAGLVLLAVARRLPVGGWWWRALVLGVLNIGAFFALLFVAAYRLPGGVAATLGATQPLIVLGLAALLLGQSPTWWRAGAGVAGVAGVAAMVLDSGARLDSVGLLAGLAGATSMATGTVLTRRWGRPVPLLAFTSWQLLAGGLVLLPVTLLVEGPPPALDAGEIAGYGWLAVTGTALAYALWFRGIERLPAQAVSFLGLLSPVVATIGGWLVLGQSLSPVQLGGLALALAALSAGQRGGRR